MGEMMDSERISWLIAALRVVRNHAKAGAVDESMSRKDERLRQIVITVDHAIGTSTTDRAARDSQEG